MPTGPSGASHRRPFECATERSMTPPLTPDRTIPLPLFLPVPAVPKLLNVRAPLIVTDSWTFGCCAYTKIPVRTLSCATALTICTSR